MDGLIKKRNYDYGKHVPSSYTVQLDKKAKEVFNVLSVNLRKVSANADGDGTDVVMVVSLF